MPRYLRAVLLSVVCAVLLPATAHADVAFYYTGHVREGGDYAGLLGPGDPVWGYVRFDTDPADPHYVNPPMAHYWERDYEVTFHGGGYDLLADETNANYANLILSQGPEPHWLFDTEFSGVYFQIGFGDVMGAAINFPARPQSAPDLTAYSGYPWSWGHVLWPGGPGGQRRASDFEVDSITDAGSHAPEPTGVTMLALGALATLARRRVRE